MTTSYPSDPTPPSDSDNPANVGSGDVPVLDVEPEVIDLVAKRRRRTNAYFRMWGVEADISDVPVIATDTLRTKANMAGRAKSLCLVALKGQGLSNEEVFAFADAYGVWEAMTLEEHDFVLDMEPTQPDMVNFAWKYEGLWVVQWALGLVRHLAFADTPVDPTEPTRRCIESIAAGDLSRLTPRTANEILDAADVARCAYALVTTAHDQGHKVGPGNLHHGVVHERWQAFRWLVGL